MSLLVILGIAVGLAMDAFAVSLGASASGRAAGPRAAFRLAFHFGLFQFAMPVVGWHLGVTVEPWIAPVDHWVALALLSFVGGRMIVSGIRGGEQGCAGDPSRGWTLVALSVATSIDALAVGLSLAMLGVRTWYPSAVIGVVTGTLSFAGVLLGSRLGLRFGQRMEAAGGALLVVIGLRILFQHLAA